LHPAPRFEPAWWNDWVSRQRKARFRELQKLKPSGPGIRRNEAKLFEYLVDRSLDNRGIDGPALQRLRKVNAAVETTRTKLDMGHGNVIEDVEGTFLEATHRAKAARRISERWFATAELGGHVRRSAIAVANAAPSMPTMLH
jgi:hypothetical protein